MINPFFALGMPVSLAILTCVSEAAPPVQPFAAAEWPGHRGGTNGNAPALAVGNLARAQIRQVWKRPTNRGFSSFAVADGAAFTLVVDEGNETLLAIDARTGAGLWSKPMGLARYDSGGDSGTPTNRGGDGPRSTPAVSEGRVYATDAAVVVWCFDAKDGKQIWKRDVIEQNDGKLIHWGNGASPVIDGGLVLVAGGGPGQALLGLDKATGEVKWKTEDERMTHATPILADILGVHQCIFYTLSGLVSVEAQTGKLLWRAPRNYRFATGASPVVYKDIVYCSAAYGVGSEAFRISKDGDIFSAASLWKTEGNRLVNWWSTPVVKDGYLYGMFSFKKYGDGPVACVDIRTGELKWSHPGFGAGQVILSGSSTVVALSDAGELILFKADPGGYQELKREKLVTGKVWSYPALAYGRIFARSTVEGGCWEVQEGGGGAPIP